jgi:hypothetical protein
MNEHEQQEPGVVADAVLEIIADRYGITLPEIIAAVRWVEERKRNGERVSQAGVTTIIGVVSTALVLALWEGVKTILKVGR